MKRLLSVISSFTDRAGEGIALVVLAIIGIVLYEVIARFVFNKPTMWATETTGLVFAVYIVLTGAYCLLHETHVRMDVLWGQLSIRRKAIADLATSILAFLFVGALVWYSAIWAWRSFEIREVSSTVWAPPLYPVKALLPIGAFWLFLQLLVKFIRDLFAVTRGNTSKGLDYND